MQNALITLLLYGFVASHAQAGYFIMKSVSGIKPVNTSAPLAQCTTPWGTSLASGLSVTAFAKAEATTDQPCTSEKRTCANGVLSGTYTHQSCKAAPALNFAKFAENVAVAANGYSVSTPLYGKYVANVPIYSGKHYVEVSFASFRSEIGVTTQSAHDAGWASATYPLERQPNAAALYMTTSLSNRLAYLHSSSAALIGNYTGVASYDSGTIGVAIDADTNQMYWQNQNGVIGAVSVKLPKPWYFTIARGNSNAEGKLNATLNSGYQPFTYAIPTGYRRGLYY